MRRRSRYILILLAVVVVGGLVLRSRMRRPTIPAGGYLVLEVSGDYLEAPPQDVLARLLSRGERTLMDLLTMIRMAQRDERLKGLIVRISALQVGWAKVQDIRNALLDF